MKVAVVGHIEWSRFVRVDLLPKPGEVVRAKEYWQEVAGGAGVAAAELARLTGDCTLFTAIGRDENGQRAIEQLRGLGVKVHASLVDEFPTKESLVYIDDNKERTITTIGHVVPNGHDPALPWDDLRTMDAVYFVSGDVAALRASRQAKVLVSTARVLPVLKEAGIQLDALVMSQKDNNELYADDTLDNEPMLVVQTLGKEGSQVMRGERYPAEMVSDEDFRDSYGCGDSFAAGLTYGLAQGLPVDETMKIAARSGAAAARRTGANGFAH
jgi:ribokinase